MSANKTPLGGELRRPAPAGASLETPRNRRWASRKKTPARRGGEEVADADANADAVREEVADALRDPGHAQGGQAAQAGQHGAANILGGEGREGLPPPPNNRDRRQDCINALRALMVLIWRLITFAMIHVAAWMTLLKRRRPKLFWSLLFALLLLLLAGFISMRSAPRPLRLHRNMDPDYVNSASMSQEQEAEQLVQVKEWTRRMREMRGKGADWEDVDWEHADITWGDEMD
ncbi:hypothetical protein HBI12_212290 [Parastagonospora nodorum]|nr:hypothetical protein HBI12_212290 [Parastagonospora nodorum]